MDKPTSLWQRLAAIGLLAFLVANWFFHWLDGLLVLLFALAFVVVMRSASGKQVLVGPRWLIAGVILLLAMAVLRMLVDR